MVAMAVVPMMVIVTMVVVMVAVVMPVRAGPAKVYAVMMTVLSKSTLDRTKNNYSDYKDHSEH